VPSADLARRVAAVCECRSDLIVVPRTGRGLLRSPDTRPLLYTCGFRTVPGFALKLWIWALMTYLHASFLTSSLTPGSSRSSGFERRTMQALHDSEGSAAAWNPPHGTNKLHAVALGSSSRVISLKELTLLQGESSTSKHEQDHTYVVLGLTQDFTSHATVRSSLNSSSRALEYYRQTVTNQARRRISHFRLAR
jgi:hypothetical protein